MCSGFTQSEDEVYVETTASGHLKNLSKKEEELEKIDAELVGIWKISQNLFEKLVVHHSVADDAPTKDYERAIANLANDHPVKVLKIDDLAWCEIDNAAHLERAKNLITKL